MSDRPFELTWTPEGMVARVRLRGSSVLSSPMLNRGTAFTGRTGGARTHRAAARRRVDDRGQLRRVYAQYLRQPDDLAKSLHLGQVRNRNEVLFYRLLTEHIHEMLPIVYTPTVGTVIERYSLEFGRRAGCTCRWITPIRWRRPSATTAWGRRGGPDRRHRLRGHPGHRRLGGGRHRDRGRETGRLHRGGRPASPPGHPGRAGHRDR
jgi:Malic enzyme